MNRKKLQRLEAKGWKVGTVQEFLGLSDAESQMVELRLCLSKALEELRRQRNLTQHQLAKAIGSSQSRVSKIEHADPSVTLDIMIMSLVTMGATRKDIAKAIAAPGGLKKVAIK